jgi:transcriptional regulator GlxA family with amidase domain
MALWCRQPRVIAATTAWMRWARRTRLSCLGISWLHDPSPPVLAALRSAAERGSRIASLCIGAFALAVTGLLDGRAATTHWQEAGHFRARFPAVRLNPDVLYVDEGQLLTSAGLSAGIDLCLYMVRLDYGAGPATIQAPGPGPGARPGKR